MQYERGSTMENLKQYTAKTEIERMLETSGLPTYAKYMMIKEIAMNYEKRYFDDVKAEYEKVQKEQEKTAQKTAELEPIEEV